MANGTKLYSAFRKPLEEVASEWFKKKGFVTQANGYILQAHDDWPKNIIVKGVSNYILQKRREKKGKEFFPLHRYVHHGLSSQALCFNLFGPLVVAKDMTPLKTAIEDIGLVWPTGTATGAFEEDDSDVFNEKTGQPTSIDLVISINGNQQFFIESKFIETGFGGCSVFDRGDCTGANPANDFEICYLHREKKTTYWEKMERYGFLSGTIRKESICPFTAYYQFFREVLFALDKGGTFVLVHDDRSPVFQPANGNGDKGLFPFLQQFIPAKHQGHVKSLSIQQIIKTLKYRKAQQGWVREFEKKYGMGSA